MKMILYLEWRTDGSMPPKKKFYCRACDELGEKADKFIRFSEGGSK